MSKRFRLEGARIGQILVPVTDLDRAVAFYGETLGLPLQMRFPGIAFFDAAGIRLYLASATEPAFAGKATIYFWVPDAADAHAALVARGAISREEPEVIFSTDVYDLWLAFVDDPDGNHIGLMHEAPKAAS